MQIRQEINTGGVAFRQCHPDNGHGGQTYRHTDRNGGDITMASRRSVGLEHMLHVQHMPYKLTECHLGDWMISN
jgi:hypothetical protein